MTVRRSYCCHYFPQPQRDDEGNTIKKSKDERKPDRDPAMKNGSSGKCRDTSLPQPNSPEEQTTGEIQRQVIEENEKRIEIYKAEGRRRKQMRL